MELIVLVCLTAGLGQIIGASDDPLVDLLKLVKRHGIGIGVEVAQVCQKNSGGISDLTVDLGELTEDGVGATNVHVVVTGGSPETNDIRAVLLDHFLGINTVAKRLVHSSSLAVHNPAVGEDLLEGSAAIQCSHRGQKRGLEPTAVLIRALQINVGGPELGGAVHQRRIMGGAGVKPAVQSILLLGKDLATAMRTGQPLGDQLHGILLEPDIGTVLVKELRDLLNRLGSGHGLFTVGAVEHGNGKTPTALTGNTPVGTLADHGFHTVTAPCGEPLHVLDSLDRLLFKGLYRAEPLGSCAEDHRLLATVVVRIGVNDLLGSEEHAHLLHVRLDDGVGILGLHAGVLACIVGMTSIVIHGNHQIHAVAHAGLIVVGTKAGSRVYATGTRIHGDVLGVHQTGGLVQEGMLCQHVLKELTGIGCQNLVILKAAHLHGLLGERLSHDVGLAVVGLHQNIAVSGMQADRHVAGERPDGGGPNDEEGLAEIKFTQLAQIVLHGEFYVYRGTGIVLVLNVSLCHSGGAEGTPGNRLQTLVDIALVEHTTEDLYLLTLEVTVHGAVRSLPVAHNAKTLEAGHLLLNEVLGKVLACLTEFGDGHFLVQLLLGILDGALDGKTVVIPTGHVGGIVPHHCLRANNKVLQGLVQSVTHVNVAVGKGRAIVEDEGLFILVLLQHRVVEIDAFPILQRIGLTLRQIGSHGKFCGRKI